MKSVDSHGSSTLLSLMKVMVSHFVSDSQKVMTATHASVLSRFLIDLIDLFSDLITLHEIGHLLVFSNCWCFQSFSNSGSNLICKSSHH